MGTQAVQVIGYIGPACLHANPSGSQFKKIESSIVFPTSNQRKAARNTTSNQYRTVVSDTEAVGYVTLFMAGYSASNPSANIGADVVVGWKNTMYGNPPWPQGALEYPPFTTAEQTFTVSGIQSGINYWENIIVGRDGWAACLLGGVIRVESTSLTDDIIVSGFLGIRTTD